MKRASRLKRIASILFMLFIFGSLIIIHVALKKKCDDLIKQKVDAEQELKNQNIIQNNLFAKYQNLTSEERIIPIAFQELGMVTADPPIGVITIEKEKILDLQALLREQYD
jgi:cell division protein FtsB